MPEYEIQFATRYIRRQFSKAVGKSIPKILAELITNADDSYKRLLNTNGTGHTSGVADRAWDGSSVTGPEDGQILIIFDRDQKRFQVVDRAEGLTDKEMEERFVTYGKESQDRSKGFRTRSLFGKGLRDVLFTQAQGQVKSIKDGLLYVCQFRWKKAAGTEHPVVDIKTPRAVPAELRAAYGLTGNGTIVEFKLAQGVHAPQHDKLVERLTNFYMLRMITQNPGRRATLRTIHSGGRIAETRLIYTAPEGELVETIHEELVDEDGTRVLASGEIRTSPGELTQGEVGYDDRQGGLLITDEDDAALDLTLFGFDEDPSARRIFGHIKLAGAGAYIRKRLDQQQPEEVLTETRDGFDKKHPFYRLVSVAIRKHLEPIVERERLLSVAKKASLPEEVRIRHRHAFDLLNKLAKDLLGSTGRIPRIAGVRLTPPPDGIAFANEHVSVQTGLDTPCALLANALLVDPADQIELIAEGPGLTVRPDRFLMGPADDPAKAVVKIFHVFATKEGESGKIIARWRDLAVEMGVDTTAREVLTPVDGLEFSRLEYNLKSGSTRSLRLYVDVGKIPLGSAIQIISESPCLKPRDRALALTRQNLITERVAGLDATIEGIRIGEGTVLAQCGTFVASATVSVVKKQPAPQGQEGVFKDYAFTPMDRKVQALLDQGQGLVLVNTKDPVNARYFGSDPYEAVQSSVPSQVRLADLVLNECVQYLVSKALESGRLDRKFPDNPEIDVWNYASEYKFGIGPEIHAQFVTG